MNRSELLKKLREPFADHLIGKLPKGTKSQNECPANEKKNCTICGGWHHPRIVHLDYVGHAAVTDRLLEVDPEWSWKPLNFGTDGSPILDKDGGMWIELTVCGVTRLGYGDAAGKIGSNAVKERIGDAIRNAAMRFGVALELWSKEDLHNFKGALEDQDKAAVKESVKITSLPEITPDELIRLCADKIDENGVILKMGIKSMVQTGQRTADAAIEWVGKKATVSAEVKAIIKAWEPIESEQTE